MEQAIRAESLANWSITRDTTALLELKPVVAVDKAAAMDKEQNRQHGIDSSPGTAAVDLRALPAAVVKGTKPSPQKEIRVA